MHKREFSRAAEDEPVEAGQEAPEAGRQAAADLGEVWARVRRRLRAELGEDVYASWFAQIDLARIEAGVVHLTVPTKFLKSWIQAHYVDRILGLFAAEDAGTERVSLDVRSSFVRPDVAKNEAAAAAARNAASMGVRGGAVAPAGSPKASGGEAGLIGSALDRRFTFASFHVGRSNAMAHAASSKVAEHAGQTPLYNPLYVHAGVGLGKTHLLQAIANEASTAGRKAIYLTADGFMYGFVTALKSQNALAFKERLRGIDLLVVDDAQFLQGKSIGQEFCHTLNALLDAGRQVIVAADRSPGDLESLDERLRSRLAGGLVVEIEPLDEALRTTVLEARITAAKAQHAGFEVSPAVIAHVARKVTANGRDLEGAVNRLLAHATLSGGPLTVEMADVAIRDLVRSREPRKVKIEDIQKLVATHYSVTRADILSARRTANVVRPRQVAMYLSKVLTPRSLPEIGRRFGGRDHTTVLHAVRKMDDLVTKDASLREEVDLLKRMLTE